MAAARSWLYLSRLAALKEFAFMGALGKAGFPVPAALEHNRHAVLMSLVPAVPLVQVGAGNTAHLCAFSPCSLLVPAVPLVAGAHLWQAHRS